MKKIESKKKQKRVSLATIELKEKRRPSYDNGIYSQKNIISNDFYIY